VTRCRVSDSFSQLMDLLSEAERAGKLKVVFWVCPKGCQGFVDWSKNDAGLSVPKCRECGEEGAAR
jgi:hypothetical protein